MQIIKKLKISTRETGALNLIQAIPSFVRERIYNYSNSSGHSSLSDKNELHEYWKQRDDTVEKNSPVDYIDHEDRSKFLLDLISPYVDKNNKILEPGCNVGRNLNYLYNHGYTNLAGIEINLDAVEVLEQEFPDLASEAKIYQGAIEEYITEFETGEFDTIITMAVLLHIHPDSDFVFEEMARVANEYIVSSWIARPRYTAQ